MSSTENPSESQALKDRPKTVSEIYGKMISQEDLKALNRLRLDETEESQSAAVKSKGWKKEETLFSRRKLALLRSGDNSKAAVKKTSEQINSLSDELSAIDKSKNPSPKRKIGSK